LLFAFSDFAWPVLVASYFWALPVNSLGGLNIFWMLGAYVDSSLGTLIPALWVHYCCWTTPSLSALWSFIPAPPVGSLYEDFGSGRVIPLFPGRCSTDESSPLIGFVADAKRGFVLVAIIDSDDVICIPEVQSSISEISGRGYRFFVVALFRTR
jgi:hypothetical protein